MTSLQQQKYTGLWKNNPRTLKITKTTITKTNKTYVHKYTGNIAQVRAFYLLFLHLWKWSNPLLIAYLPKGGLLSKSSINICFSVWITITFPGRKIMIYFFHVQTFISELERFHKNSIIFFVPPVTLYLLRFNLLLLLTNHNYYLLFSNLFFNDLFKVDPLVEFLLPVWSSKATSLETQKDTN